MPAQGTKVKTKKHAVSEKLINYMKEKSSIEKRREKLEEIKTRGKNLIKQETEELQWINTRSRSLKNTKSEVLDEIIFPSMANLCFFFEAISKFPELQHNFESDIRELFGIRRLHPRVSNYAFVFVTLINAMITTKNAYEKNDYRIKLIHELQKQIWYKFQEISSNAFPTGSAFMTVTQDIQRAMAWTEMIASTVKDEYDFENPPYYGIPEQIPEELKKDEAKKSKYKEERGKQRVKIWDEFCANYNKPHRTFDFDTRKMIES